MYGQAAAPPPGPPQHRPGAKGMALRLLFASFPLWSLGLLAWVPSLRFAVIRRRPLDRAVFAGSAVLTAVYVVLLFTVDEGEEGGWASAAAGLYFMAFLVGTTAHAVLADRFPRPPAPLPSPRPTPYPVPHPAQPPGPVHAADIAGAPTVYGSSPPAAPPPAPYLPHPPRPHSHPQSPRMRQVASELDELEELLRGRDGQDGRGWRESR
ncbi:MAG TPA: hypothetical protein VFY14_15110 [Streptomyces sp.]|nr:hypothetical protein [Streptomyces sp.]